MMKVEFICGRQRHPRSTLTLVDYEVLLKCINDRVFSTETRRPIADRLSTTKWSAADRRAARSFHKFAGSSMISDGGPIRRDGERLISLLRPRRKRAIYRPTARPRPARRGRHRSGYCWGWADCHV